MLATMHIAQRFGLAHQGHVPCVQVAHGGHKGGAATPSQGAAQIGNGVNDLHES